MIEVIVWALTSRFVYWMFLIAIGIWAINSVTEAVEKEQKRKAGKENNK